MPRRRRRHRPAVGVTGAAAQALDSQDASSKALAIVGLATFGLILLLMVVIFRSVILALIPLLVIGLVSQVAVGLIGAANKIFDLKTDSSIQVILIVVLFGIGTDYILFFLFRYRERLRLGEDHKAVVQAVERAGEAIASAGGAVIVSFMALVLSSLGIFRSIGPALAIAVAVTVLAALTLVPAVVSLLGTRIFWPSKTWKKEPESARFAAIGRSLGRQPAVFARFGRCCSPYSPCSRSASTRPSTSATPVRPRTSSPRSPSKTLQTGFPPGATDPTSILLTPPTAARSTRRTSRVRSGDRQGDGVAQIGPGRAQQDGDGVYSVVLDTDPTSDAALADVKGPVRAAAHDAAPTGTEALVGGTTSVFVDFQKAMNRDYKVVFPVAAIVIMLILALLLRSLVAPIYLMISVGLGFGATLGAAVIVFQHIKGNAGLIFLLPIYIYLFVVALGTDYNILMIARLREEAETGKSSRDAAAEAVKHAGPTVAAAGVILAGTFASLMLGGNSLLVAMGFSISFGIFVAAFVMAMFFTPALTALIGHAAWWPGHGDETVEEPEEPGELVSSGTHAD